MKFDKVIDIFKQNNLTKIDELTYSNVDGSTFIVNMSKNIDRVVSVTYKLRKTNQELTNLGVRLINLKEVDFFVKQTL